uniref:Uncharacterized protein n=1 Tax=Mycobacterium riyadhense TaxID=486698 RepID=A0A653EVA2_9MYCO|nr:hypothetical protein BIN_B_03956 [Mycobacterium riyadhense]
MSCSLACTASIAPGAQDCMSRPRALTNTAASGRENTPARWAAVSSPMECPSRQSGVIPMWVSVACMATPMANNAGWA